MRNGFQTILQLVQNNFGQVIGFNLQDSSGVAVDISNATVAIKCQLDSDNTVSFTEAMQIVDASNGRCSYTVQATDFVVPGTWNAQIVVTYNAGEVLTFFGINIQVEPALPIS